MASQETGHPGGGSLRTAMAVAGLLVEHQAEETVVLDVSRQNGWTDYFVIATTRSHVHLRGLLRHLDTALSQLGDAGRERPGHSLRRAPDDSGWVLVDLGAVVVHLMTDEQRRFYELERLWFRSPIVFRNGASPAAPGARPQ
jgi:ribosome-associated protein